MKKADIIDKLTAAEVAIPEGATVADLEALAAEHGVSLEEKAEPKTVKVKALRPINEDGQYYDKGAVLEVTPRRAKAIAHCVETV